MKLQRAKARFEEQGIKLAGISYDSRAILEEFSERHQIDFPLMADPGSKVIDQYRVLNEAATGLTKGMAYPGFFYLDPKGVIREKYFEANYVDRFTPNNVIAKMFPELAEEVRQKVEAPHLDMTLAQTDKAAIPGSRVSLIVEVGLPKGTHVYAPEVTGGYIPIALTLQAPPEVELAAAAYPRAKTLFLAAIKERVPVFEGKFRISQDVRIAGSMDLIKSLGDTGKTVQVAGTFKYQACDEKVCYPPTSVPVSWTLHVVPLDAIRSPEAIRHRAPP